MTKIALLSMDKSKSKILGDHWHRILSEDEIARTDWEICNTKAAEQWSRQ